MKKLTITAIFLFSIIGLTITSYANWTTAVPKSTYEAPYTDPSSMPGGKDNPWAGSTMAHLVVMYPGRIEGTWQKRGDDYYYVLPDGSDLKNNYVDGLYLSWTGKMMKELYNKENIFLYNHLYGGHMPTSNYVEGKAGSFSDGLLDADLSHEYGRYSKDYTEGRWDEPNAARDALVWMDSNMPNLIALPERERVIAIGRLVANRMELDPVGARSVAYAWRNSKANEYSYIQLYAQFLRRAGINAICVGGGARSDGINGNWATVKVNGAMYFSDIVMYDRTKQDTYLLSTNLWTGYLTEREVGDRIVERSKEGNAQIRDEELANPTPKGGRPISSDMFSGQ